MFKIHQNKDIPMEMEFQKCDNTEKDKILIHFKI